MPITREEFEEKRETSISEMSLLHFLYDNKSKAYTLRELFSDTIMCFSNDFASLACRGYIDNGVDRTQANTDYFTFSENYYTISEKGIKKLMEKISEKEIKKLMEIK